MKILVDTTKILPIPPEQICGPYYPVVANYIAWLLMEEVKSPNADKFGKQLLKYLEA